MSRQPDSAEPTDRLEGEAELSRLYRDEVEPPAELDASILAASRRAVGAGPQRRRGWAQRWTGPLAVAAVLVLAVTLVSLMPREQLTPEPQPAAPARVLQSEPVPTEEKRHTLVPSVDGAPDRPAARSLNRPEEVPAPAKAFDYVPADAARPERERRQVPQLLESDSIERPAQSSAVTDPELWRRRIEALVELGDYAQAARELEAFRQSYPDYPPGELERRLEGLTD